MPGVCAAYRGPASRVFCGGDVQDKEPREMPRRDVLVSSLYGTVRGSVASKPSYLLGRKIQRCIALREVFIVSGIAVQRLPDGDSQKKFLPEGGCLMYTCLVMGKSTTTKNRTSMRRDFLAGLGETPTGIMSRFAFPMTNKARRVFSALTSLHNIHHKNCCLIAVGKFDLLSMSFLLTAIFFYKGGVMCC